MSAPSRSARLSVGRNGAPEGIVKTRGARWAMRAFYAAREGRQAGPREARFSSFPQCRGEPFPCVLVGRNSESQAVRSVRERADENSCGQQPREGGARVGMSAQPKETRPADDSPAAAAQEGVETCGVLAQARARYFEPIRIGERPDANCNRRPADRPWAEREAQRRHDVWRSE